MTLLYGRLHYWKRFLVEAEIGLWKNNRGQDLIEYALMAGIVAVSAGALMPGVSNNISTIFSKVASVLVGAASQGS